MYCGNFHFLREEFKTRCRSLTFVNLKINSEATVAFSSNFSFHPWCCFVEDIPQSFHRIHRRDLKLAFRYLTVYYCKSMLFRNSTCNQRESSPRPRLSKRTHTFLQRDLESIIRIGCCTRSVRGMKDGSY